MANGTGVMGHLSSLKTVGALVATAISTTFGVTVWFTRPSEPVESSAATADVALTARVLELESRVEALGDSLQKAYAVQEFSFCKAVPPNERSQMRVFRIDCSDYEGPGGERAGFRSDAEP